MVEAYGDRLQEFAESDLVISDSSTCTGECPEYQKWKEQDKEGKDFKRDLDKRGFQGIYIPRCEHYRDNPPGDDWDGSWALTKK